jgi:hypothetical protein
MTTAPAAPMRRHPSDDRSGTGFYGGGHHHQIHRTFPDPVQGWESRFSAHDRPDAVRIDRVEADLQNPHSTRLRITARPTDPGRSEAPTTAMDLG